MLKPCYTKAELIEELKCLALEVDQINAVIIRSAIETINKYADAFDMVDARVQRLQKQLFGMRSKE